MARDASGNDSSATAVAIQSDGGIVVAGSTGMYLAVVRYLPDGAEDPNFQQWDASGAIGSASSVVIQPNNMILVGGTFVGAQWYYYGVGARGGAHPMDRPNNASYSLGVARFNVNGSLDTSFNSGASFSSSAGYVTDGTGNGIGCGMALQPDGSLIVAGGVSDSSNPLVPSYVPVVERVTAGDIGGSEVRVDNASPALPLSGDGYVAAGDTYTLTLGSPLPAGEGQGEGSEGGEPINLGSGTDVSYTVNWGDNTPATTITADDLAAAGDQVTHTFTTTSTGITVDLTVDSTPYYEVGSLAVNVDTNTATNTSLSITNSPANFGDTASLQATVAADLAGIGAPTGTVEFYDQIGSGPVIDLGPGDFDSSTGIATLTTPPLAGGDNTFTAVYSGDSFFQSSASAAASATVGTTTNTVSIGTSYSTPEGSLMPSLPSVAGGELVTSWTVYWGDGTGYTEGSAPDTYAFGDDPYIHPYGAPGTYTIIAVAHSLSGWFEGTAQVTVSQAGPGIPTVTADNAQYSGADTEDGGSVAPDQLHVSFTGPASQESYTVTINWGGADDDDDGTTTFSLGPGQTSFDYPLPQYAVAGTYPITLTVTDAESNYAASSAFYVTYTNSAPSGWS